MRIKILIDMNLSTEWVPLLAEHGWEAVHWSDVGNPRAPDEELMAWARNNSHTVFTHDLDFGTLLALTHADGPSVVQVRGQRVLPEQISSVVITAIRKYEEELTKGALVVIEESKNRIRILPL